MTRLVLALCVVLCAVSHGWAVVYYVDNNAARCAGCSDSNTCVQAQTITTARDTINQGMACLASGDTLYIRGGTYTECIADQTTSCAGAVTPPNGTDWNNATLISGYQDEIAIIRPALGPTSVIRFWKTTGTRREYIIFDKLTLDATVCSPSDARDCHNVIMNTSRYIRFSNSHMFGGRQSCILLADSSGIQVTGIEILNNEIHNCGRTTFHEIISGHGIYVSQPGNLVEGNLVYDVGGYLYHIYASEATPQRRSDNNIMRYNRGHSNGRRPGTGDGAVAVSGDNNLVHNNEIWNFKNDGFKVQYKNAQANQLYNNTATCGLTTGARAFYINSDARNTVLRNNLAWRVTTAYLNNGISTTQSHNMFSGVNPLFVQDCVDFNTRTGSPARNAGTDLSAFFTQDVVGNPRPGGGADTTFDIGAREFVEEGAGQLVLQITVPPASGTLVGAPFDVIAHILDAQQALQDIDSGDCTLAKTAGDGTLAGCTLTVTPTNGVCTWTGCTISTAGTDKQLTASRASTTDGVTPIFTIQALPVAPTGLRVQVTQ